VRTEQQQSDVCLLTLRVAKITTRENSHFFLRSFVFRSIDGCLRAAALPPVDEHLMAKSVKAIVTKEYGQSLLRKASLGFCRTFSLKPANLPCNVVSEPSTSLGQNQKYRHA
jgi:hypothetical protein